MLTAGDTPQQELIYLIDDIQRLGFSYHFETEIETILQHLMDSFLEYYGTKNHDNLHDVALSFRLLRQEGHNVSSGGLTVWSSFNNLMRKAEVQSTDMCVYVCLYIPRRILQISGQRREV